MRSGDLRRQIQFQQRQTPQDTYGGRSTTWVNGPLCWADIQPLQGRELVTAQEIASTVTHMVTIRYRTGITPDMRIVYEGRLFGILAIIDVDTRHWELQILCQEGLDDGT